MYLPIQKCKHSPRCNQQDRMTKDGSLVDEFPVDPLFLLDLVARHVLVHEHSVPLSIYIFSEDSHVLFVLGFYKFAMLDVHFPSSLKGLLLRFMLIDTLSVLFVFREPSFECITISICQFSFSIYFIVLEAALIREGVSALGQCQPAFTLFFAIYEIAFIQISVSVFQSTSTLEFPSVEGTLISFIFEHIFSLHFFVVLEHSIKRSPIGLLENTLSMLLSHFELTLILIVELDVFQFAQAIKFVFMEASFILSHALQKILTKSFFHIVEESTLISESVA